MVARFPLTNSDHPVFTRNRTLVAARKQAEEKRSLAISRVPESMLLNVLAQPSASGVRVNTLTAATVPVVAACVGLFSDMVGKLPIKLYRRTETGAEEMRDHPAYRLISIAPSDVSTPIELRQLAQTGVGFGGNGYIRVYRDGFYQPAELQWLPPCDVQPELLKRTDGRRLAVYHLQGERAPLNRADLIHVRGHSINGITGMSPITQLRESIGLSITQREQAGKIAANGARFPGVLSTPQSLSPDQMKDARTEWQRNQGGSGNSGKTAILHGAWSYAATNGMSMADAEFLESRKFERTEICTLYRIPEVLLGNSDKASAWGTGIETLTNGFLTLGLDPVLVNWEQSLNYTLLTADEQAQGFYFRFNRRAALAMLPDATAKFLRDMRDIGVYSKNDCRRYLDENLLTAAQGGEDYSAPFNGSGGAVGTKSGATPTTHAA